MKDLGVEIIPNRQQIDDRFPVLGFTLKTGGLPYYEVIVTTEKRLFAPALAAERTSENFFSSRQANNQLQRTDGNDSVYIVPSSVLNSFAQGNPKPSAIYFTLIAYNDETGGDPRFAHSIDSLATNAPSVAMEPSFTGKTLSVTLGVPVESLRRVEPAAMNLAFSPANEYVGQSLADPDEGEAEDGYTLLNTPGRSMSLGSIDDDTLYPEDGYEFNQRRESAGQSYDDDSLTPYGDNSDVRYQDGLEDELGYVRGTYANMQESSFPAGASEPDELYDEDSPRYGEGESFSEREDTYSVPQSSASRNDSGFEYAGAAAGYSSNGYGHSAAYASPAYYDDDEDFFRSQSDDFEEDYGSSLSYGGEGARAAETGEDGTSIAAARRIKARKKIVESVAKFESGVSGNPYKAINADTEFSSLTWHDAFKKYHIGLSYGIVQFTQDGGSLGALLTMMRDRDKAVFDKTFGSALLADELISVTTAVGAFSKETKSGRSVRVQPVDGKDIWLSPWKERFEAAGDHTPFQAAQNELANSEYLEKILEFCSNLGLDTDRAVAMVYDRSVNMGVGGAKKWVIGAVGPIQTGALQQQALKALGKKDLTEFQKGAGLKADGDWGPMSHAAMVSALRALGSKSPIPIPTRDQMLDSMVRAAAGQKWQPRLKGLHDSSEFSDSAFPF